MVLKVQMDKVIFEFIVIGNAIKVTAIDEQSGREVSIVGDPHASQRQLEEVAMQKLQYVLHKENL